MKEESRKDIERYIADTLTDRPYEFVIAGQHFFFYPLTLGKMYRLQPLIESIEVNTGNLQRDVSLEALRLVREKREECLTIITYHTCRTKEELSDSAFVEERRQLFGKELDDGDLASLMIMALLADKTGVIMHYLGIDKDNESVSTVMRIKASNDKSNLTFGGRSVFGTLLDAACERYGWTDEYVTWGIGYTKLRLMLADKVNSVYITDEERRRLPRSVMNSQDKDRVNGDDRKSVRKAIKSQSWD